MKFAFNVEFSVENLRWSWLHVLYGKDGKQLKNLRYSLKTQTESKEIQRHKEQTTYYKNQWKKQKAKSKEQTRMC